MTLYAVVVTTRSSAAGVPEECVDQGVSCGAGGALYWDEVYAVHDVETYSDSCWGLGNSSAW
jgi:hypothetical protein